MSWRWVRQALLDPSVDVRDGGLEHRMLPRPGKGYPAPWWDTPCVRTERASAGEVSERRAVLAFVEASRELAGGPCPIVTAGAEVAWVSRAPRMAYVLAPATGAVAVYCSARAPHGVGVFLAGIPCLAFAFGLVVSGLQAALVFTAIGLAYDALVGVVLWSMLRSVATQREHAERFVDRYLVHREAHMGTKVVRTGTSRPVADLVSG